MSNPKTNAPFHAPQILLDQFQRPVAPIPGATMLDQFALQIFCSQVGKLDELTTVEKYSCIRHSIELAKILLDELYKVQSESNIAEAKLINIRNNEQ